MKENIIILGYYKRERDGNEYVHYSRNGEEHLTNGIFDWNNKGDRRRISRYMQQLIKVEEINFDVIKARLNESKPYSGLVKKIGLAMKEQL